MASLTRKQFLQAGIAAALTAEAAAAAAAEAPAAKPVKPAPAPAGAGMPLAALALNRCAFGPRPGDLEAFKKLGATPTARLRAFLEQQLHPETLADADCERRLAAANLETLKKTGPELWADHQVAADKLRDEQKNAPVTTSTGTVAAVAMSTAAVFSTATRAKVPVNDYQLRAQPVRELESAAWIRAVYSRRQLHEVLVDFWHTHFSVYAWDAPITATFVPYDRDVIRVHALGNFRKMLEAVAQSPAMLFYLDGFINQSGNPNENYARELFELHTLGAENYLGTKDRREVEGYAQGKPVGYVDGDVYEAARALTGWRVTAGQFEYFEQWHDRFQKIVLASGLQEYQAPLKDGRDVLDLLASHPGTAHHVSLRLCRRLVADDPPARLVDAAAKVFLAKKDDPHQLRAVVKLIVLSPEFAASGGGKLKRPFEAVASALRAGPVEFAPTEGFVNAFGKMGQRHFQWRTPDGYPDARDKWAGASSLLERWRLFNQLAAGGVDGAKPDWRGQTPASAKAPAAVVAHWATRLLGRAPSRGVLDEATAFLGQGRNRGYELPDDLLRERLGPTIALLLMSPDFQWR
jgi:uncharacterized protein (DUF1800 family)